MNIIPVNPRKSLNKAFLKQKPRRSEIELFKANLIVLLDHIDEIEREENQKNHILHFLRDTYYKDTNEINTKDTKDLVIHLGKTNKDKVGVIIEAKRPGNKSEMISAAKPNVKALQELVLYYLRERIEENNIDIKYLIATNVYEWFIFEAATFEKLFYRNKAFVKHYEQWRDGQKVTKDTSLFYNDIAKPFIDELTDEITCTYFDIRQYETILRNADKEDDKRLIALQKLLSPSHLLKVPFANDSNALNDKFYKELLHIIGLEEVKEGSKNIIRRKLANRQTGSLLENTINILITDDSLRRIRDKAAYGETRDEQLFNIALELCLTWINRVLFLKLLEGQLITYHKGDADYRFLNSEMIADYDELYKLFHQVLARNIGERTPNVQHKYSKVPYLNSSLFEISELESLTLKINSLDNSETLELTGTTILKDERKKNTALPALEYLFKFLDAYDFASEGGEDIAEENKTIINASVLGKVFEKINGYKDGSIFTPGFITMYMSRQSLRPAVIQKFNAHFKTAGIAESNTFEELYNHIDKVDIKTANEIVNSLRVCDPAVGSGHFLVSALNEIILIKSELGILADATGKRLRDYEFTIENDELIITDEHGLFAYNHLNKESQRVQETIFGERQTIIENCLFGVDINPNSVKICRLRLWIELLKSSYYLPSPVGEEPGLRLETLPNIDINIKCGNSLISRYALDADIKKALKRSKWNIKDYQIAVMSYRNAHSKDEKRAMEDLIRTIKNDFETEVQTSDKRFVRLSKTKGELFNLTMQGQLFDKSKKELAEWNNKVAELSALITKLEKEIEEIKNNAIYKNAFEWRFEFPEVLNDEGDFVGFDVVIGNPPYVYRNSEIEAFKEYFKSKFYNNSGNYDLYKYFIEQAIEITKKNYFHSFITNSSFILQTSFEKTRKYLLENSSILILAPLGPNVFDEATVDSAVYILQKIKLEDNLIRTIVPTMPRLISETKSYNINQKRFLSNDGLVFDYLLQSDQFQLVNRLLSSFPSMERGFEFGVGINTGYIKSDLTSDFKIDERYHPMVPGTGISRYGDVNAKGYIMYDKDFVKSKGKLGRSLPDERFFTHPKILVVRTRNLSLKQRIIATIDFEQKYNLNRLSNIIPRSGYSIEGLLAVLNSKLYNWLFSNRYYDYEIKPIYLRNSPLCNVNDKYLCLCSKQILEAKKQGQDTTALEQQVDELVYQLYGITEEERGVIEGA